MIWDDHTDVMQHYQDYLQDLPQVKAGNLDTVSPAFYWVKHSNWHWIMTPNLTGIECDLLVVLGLHQVYAHVEIRAANAYGDSVVLWSDTTTDYTINTEEQAMNWACKMLQSRCTEGTNEHKMFGESLQTYWLWRCHETMTSPVPPIQ